MKHCMVQIDDSRTLILSGVSENRDELGHGWTQELYKRVGPMIGHKVFGQKSQSQIRNSASIYKYSPDEWILLSETMKHPRFYHASMFVSQTLIKTHCQ